MADSGRAPMQMRQVLDDIRRRILQGDLASNARVNIASLAAELGISTGAVREALAVLEVEAFVVSEPMKGYRVKPISQEDLRSLVAARIDIENLCLADAIRNGDDAWEASIVATHYRLKRLHEKNGGDVHASTEWAAAHQAFHAALVSGCANPWLLRMHGMLYAQSERYRYLSIRITVNHRHADVEHGKLVDAVLARDIDTSQKLMSEHLSLTATALLDALTHSDDKIA
jgi:DNA-binding GntR family transcriptional regulator